MFMKSGSGGREKIQIQMSLERTKVHNITITWDTMTLLPPPAPPLSPFISLILEIINFYIDTFGKLLPAQLLTTQVNTKITDKATASKDQSYIQ